MGDKSEPFLSPTSPSQPEWSPCNNLEHLWPFPLKKSSSSALLSTKPFYSSGSGQEQRALTPHSPDHCQALLSSPNRLRAGARLLSPPPLPEAAHGTGLWCSVPAISGTGLGQELSFNEILLKDSITNSHLSK